MNKIYLAMIDYCFPILYKLIQTWFVCILECTFLGEVGCQSFLLPFYLFSCGWEKKVSIRDKLLINVNYKLMLYSKSLLLFCLSCLELCTKFMSYFFFPITRKQVPLWFKEFITFICRIFFFFFFLEQDGEF